MTDPIKPAGKSLEQMLEENLLLTREVYSQTQKIRRHMFLGQILNVVKLVLIIGPIIVGIFFLQPYLKQIFSTYSELLGGGWVRTRLDGGGALQEILGNTNEDTIKNYSQILENSGVNLKSR